LFSLEEVSYFFPPKVNTDPSSVISLLMCFKGHVEKVGLVVSTR
jgi:hypothetical protein